LIVICSTAGYIYLIFKLSGSGTMSLQVKKLTNTSYEISCGDDKITVYGAIATANSPYKMCPSIPVGGRAGGISTFTLVCPGHLDVVTDEVHKMVAGLDMVPQFQDVLTAVKNETPEEPGFILITFDEKQV
jgi:hypothetical protein